MTSQNDPVLPKRRHRVEQIVYTIDIRRIKKAGLLVPGQQCSGYFGHLLVKCDLRVPESPWVWVYWGECSQVFALVSRAVGRGTRWFFNEKCTGVVCEKMYLSADAGFASRKRFGLAYGSQLLSPNQRKLRRAKKIHDAILGSVEKGPARGQSKLAKKQELKALSKELRKYASTLRNSIY